MRKRFGVLTAAGALVLAVTFALLSLYQSALTGARQSKRVYSVTALTRSASDRFVMGIERAAQDLNVDLHLLTDFDADDAVVQSARFLRELENDIDAVVLEPENPQAMSELLDTLTPPPTVVTIEHKLPGKDIPHIGSDNLEIGDLLGDMVKKRIFAQNTSAQDQMILALTEYNPRESTKERLEGLKTSIKESSASVTWLECESEADAVASASRTAFFGASAQNPIIVCLDEELLEPACEGAPQNAAIFGVGFPEGARQRLESGRVKALALQSDYDAGYLALQSAVHAVDGRVDAGARLSVYEANKDNMYDDPIASVLFPVR